jgi:hypothetical protein
MTATVHYLPSARHHWAADANEVLDAAAQLDATDAIRFCELAVSYLEANASELDDPTPLVRLAERLGEITARARAARAAGPASARHPAHRPRAR